MRVLIVLLLLLAASPALGTPKQDFDHARAAFRSGQFNLALKEFNALLYPDPKLASREDLAEAYVALGVCRLETGDLDGARREFEKALAHDPNWQLDPLVIKNQNAIRLFDDTKADLRTRAEREAEKRKAAELIEAQRKYLESLRVYEARPYYPTFLPFGFGQFNNGRYVKGGLFLGGQLVTLGTSAGIWYYLVSKYGLRSDRVPLDDGPSVRRLQQIEIGAGIAFFGLYVWSAIDAHLDYEPTRRVKGDESLLPPELRVKEPPPAPTKKSSLLQRMRIAPMATSDGLGIGIGWEN